MGSALSPTARKRLLSTKSVGVDRLSLICGLLAAGYGYVDTAHQNRAYVPSTQLGLAAALYFLCGWLSIRVMAWIVGGFRNGQR